MRAIYLCSASEYYARTSTPQRVGLKFDPGRTPQKMVGELNPELIKISIVAQQDEFQLQGQSEYEFHCRFASQFPQPPQKLAELKKELNSLSSQAEYIKEQIEEIRDEEQEAFDNLPEGIQAGDRGQAMEEAANNLDEAAANMEDVVGGINAVIEYLEEASN